jgi:uncharacterized phage-associated protein
MYDVRDVANFILDLADERGAEISNLSLQKLLYFSHGWFYSIYDQPLIKNKFEAWQYGPVQRVIYEQFKPFGSEPIRKKRAKRIDPLTGDLVLRPHAIAEDHKAVIRAIWEKYERFTAGQLVNESHTEDGPWEYVWKQADEAIYPGMKIPDTLISDHFKRLGSIFTLH